MLRYILIVILLFICLITSSLRELTIAWKLNHCLHVLYGRPGGDQTLRFVIWKEVLEGQFFDSCLLTLKFVEFLGMSHLDTMVVQKLAGFTFEFCLLQVIQTVLLIKIWVLWDIIDLSHNLPAALTWHLLLLLLLRSNNITGLFFFVTYLIRLTWILFLFFLYIRGVDQLWLVRRIWTCFLEREQALSNFHAVLLRKYLTTVLHDLLDRRVFTLWGTRVLERVWRAVYWIHWVAYACNSNTATLLLTVAFVTYVIKARFLLFIKDG